MTSFTTRNRRQHLQANFERRHRWNRNLLMGSTGLGGVLAGLALGAGGAWGQVGPNTLPTNGQVVAGSATINQANPNTLNINQTTNRAVINWSSFDVGANASVNFYQPNAGSWTLNRVTNSVAPSQILGHLTANGNIAVINSNGVIFGPGSRVDVNGLVATTANIGDQNFMAGNMKFDQAGSGTAMVSNFGDITVKDAGLVAFVAPGVSNSGTITARLGKVSLASGQKFTLDLYGDKLVSIAADGAVTEAPIGPNGQKVAALVDNSGKIVAEGGQIQLTARQASRLVDNAVNMSGVVQAQSAYVANNGDIVLDAGPAGNVVVSGTLDASGKGAGQKGGQIAVTGKDNVLITGTAKIDASGNAGGGKIKIGGDFHGQGTTPTAKTTTVVSGAQINANAINAGNGGQVVVWSEDTTGFSGNISARGGDVSGNGGSVEVSGKNTLNYWGGTVDTRALHGLTGTLLLDPRSLDIVSAAATGMTSVVGNTILGNVPGTLTDADIVAALATNNVLISTFANGTGTGSGVLTVHTGVNITWTNGDSLSLVASDDTGVFNNVASGIINIQSGVTIGGAASIVNITAGTVTMGSNLSASVMVLSGNSIHDFYVADTGFSLQKAIDMTNTFGTVHLAVDNNTWVGNLNLNKPINLVGGINDTVQAGANGPAVIEVAHGALLGDFTISGITINDGAFAVTNGLLVDGAQSATLDRVFVVGSSISSFSGAGISITNIGSTAGGVTVGGVTITGGGITRAMGGGVLIGVGGGLM